MLSNGSLWCRERERDYRREDKYYDERYRERERDQRPRDSDRDRNAFGH